MADNLVDILKTLWTPDNSGSMVVRSDAPGTNERDHLHEGQDYNAAIEISSALPRTPEPWKRARHDGGPGPSGMLGYADHGDPVRIAKRLNEKTRGRFPDLATHGLPGPHAPEFNTLYDVFKSTEAYDKTVLATAHGSWVVGTTTTQPVVLDNLLPPVALFSQFPHSVQVYPVLLLFTYSMSAAATGQFSMTFTPQGGDFAYPLGEYSATSVQTFNTMRHVIRASITDPGQTALGTIIIQSIGVAGTPTILWRMGLGFAAFLPTPAFQTSQPLHVQGWIDSAPEPDRQETPHMISVAPR